MNEEHKARIEFADKLGQTKDKFKGKQHARAVELLTKRNVLAVKLHSVKDKYAEMNTGVWKK